MRLRPKCVTGLTSESDIRAEFLNLSQGLCFGKIMIVPVSQSEGARPKDPVTMTVRSGFMARLFTARHRPLQKTPIRP